MNFFWNLMLGIFVCFAMQANAYQICPNYLNASRQLKALHDEDQADRLNTNKIDSEVEARDEARRVKVATLFAEGCLKSEFDFYHAAMVFQHGKVPEHFYQTFIWSKNAFDLSPAGSQIQKDSKWLMAAGLDRYLVNIKHKQLFATQFSRPIMGCWCLNSRESSFPEAKITEYTSVTLADQWKRLAKLNEGLDGCGQARECSDDGIQPSPQGTVPGFW